METRRFLAAGLVILFLVAACGNKAEVERLAATVHEQESMLREREVAAQQCEDLFDAERQRNNELERLMQMRLPISIQQTPVLDSETLEGLPENTQVKVTDQIQVYKAAITQEFDALMAINQDLKRALQGLGTSVRVEARITRDANQEQTRELRGEIGGQTERLDRYLARLNELSGTTEELINQIQSFNQNEVACVGCWKLGVRKEKKDVVLGFNSSLVRQLTELQTEMTSR